tara:strand:- start:645 stop:848 length:204 start_codon:yes stop_codon:yes gene_type:complete
MKHYAVARNGNQFFVINGNYEIIERCHNRATAAHFAKKLNDSVGRVLCMRTWTFKDAVIGHGPAIFA